MTTLGDVNEPKNLIQYRVVNKDGTRLEVGIRKEDDQRGRWPLWSVQVRYTTCDTVYMKQFSTPYPDTHDSEILCNVLRVLPSYGVPKDVVHDPRAARKPDRPVLDSGHPDS